MDRSLSQLLDLFGLKDRQREAVVERSHNLAVTAGAGSGKTRTLVTRYLSLLAEGYLPRQVAAITFTEKASREMRSRTRAWLRQLILSAENPERRQYWADLDTQMDSAHIGTIHSLCAEILRSHPAEACLDPRFVVVEQNQAAAFRAAAVENGLVWAVQQPGMEALFRAFTLNPLNRLLAFLLEKRLEITPEAFNPTCLIELVSQALSHFFKDNNVDSLRIELTLSLSNQTLTSEAGEAMAVQVVDLLALLDRAEHALDQNEPVQAAQALFQVRRSQMRLNVGKRASITKEAVKSLREYYDQHLLAWLGGASANDQLPDLLVEQIAVELAPLIEQIYQQVLSAYRTQLNDLSGLDFDDLEAGTVSLLQIPSIRKRWQDEIASVLVDEFQDTNARQRSIILGLAGEIPGRLFVVGDARQSIYRFRGAEVSVFTGLQAELKQQGGISLNLDHSYRAHPSLLRAIGALLQPIMADTQSPEPPFHIPYSQLFPVRTDCRAGIRPPFVECILAAAEDAETARPIVAHALARRLSQLNQSGEIKSWDEVALLFRASAPFPIYEQALEDFGIPFVTVAGSGFYDRPEVRDLINMLRALSDPWDDQALAGLLRSPAFGVSDVGIYLLRCPASNVKPLYDALRGDLSALLASDRVHCQRALEILTALEPLVDRLPVSELLQQLVNHTDYRATLASCADLPGSSRLWRNVDKLISDAQLSGQVRIRAFLEYVDTMRDVGAREAEAASEAEGSVRLMTIHKSKGLEFPFVVLADAARRPYSGRDIAFRSGNAWTFAPDKLESAPLGFRLAKWQDLLQSEAEEQRLLYVAMTRAQEKLIISGHLRQKNGQVMADGWLSKILNAGGILPGALCDQPDTWQRFSLPGDVEWSLYLASTSQENSPILQASAPPWPESQEKPLSSPLVVPPLLSDTFIKHRGLSLEPRTPPARIVGNMVHKALQRWRFPGDSALEPLLQTQAQTDGLLNEDLLHQAVLEAENLLRRFQRHPLYAEMDNAIERHHEVPYTILSAQGQAEWGFIDCIYRLSTGWRLVDFKTDELRSQQALEAVMKDYRPQLQRYQQAATTMIGEAPQSQMCFLNFEGNIIIMEK